MRVQERAAVAVSAADLAGHGTADCDALAGRVSPGLLDRAIDDAFPFRAAPPQVSDDEVVLAGEIPVQQVLAATALVNDLLQADRVHALLAEEARRRVQDPVARSGCGLSPHLHLPAHYTAPIGPFHAAAHDHATVTRVPVHVASRSGRPAGREPS